MAKIIIPTKIMINVFKVNIYHYKKYTYHFTKTSSCKKHYLRALG